MPNPIRGVSSMATRGLLAELAAEHARTTGRVVEIVSVGGVDAAKRVRAGEAFDVVILASTATADLARDGFVEGASLVDVARSGIAAAVPAGRPCPTLTDEADLAAALLGAPRIAYSTGPSGDHILRLVARLGVGDAVAARLVQAPPGIPVAGILAAGDADLGFQQFSELAGVSGIAILGPLPPGTQLTTVFTAGICRAAEAAGAARDFVAWLSAPETGDTKRRHGLEPV